jgi:hypothetical protein
MLRPRRRARCHVLASDWSDGTILHGGINASIYSCRARAVQSLTGRLLKSLKYSRSAVPCRRGSVPGPRSWDSASIRLG